MTDSQLLQSATRLQFPYGEGVTLCVGRRDSGQWFAFRNYAVKAGFSDGGFIVPEHGEGLYLKREGGWGNPGDEDPRESAFAFPDLRELLRVAGIC